MPDIFLKWLVPFVCGGVITALITILKKEKSKDVAIGNGVQCLLRAEIIRSYDKYTERGSCPVYAKDALRIAYASYHTLGGNDVATELYRKIMKLPTEKEVKQ